MFCLSLHRLASHRMYLFSIQPSSQHFGPHPACVADGLPFLSSTVFLRGFHPCALSGLSFWPPKQCSRDVSKSAPKQLSTPCFPAVFYRMSVIVTRCSLLHQHRLLYIHSLFMQPQAPLKGLHVVTERWGQCIVAKLLSGTQVRLLDGRHWNPRALNHHFHLTKFQTTSKFCFILQYKIHLPFLDSMKKGQKDCHSVRQNLMNYQIRAIGNSVTICEGTLVITFVLNMISFSQIMKTMIKSMQSIKHHGLNQVCEII